MRVKEDIPEVVMGYKKLISEFSETIEELHSVWNEEAGNAFYDKGVKLAEEMTDSLERIMKWLG